MLWGFVLSGSALNWQDFSDLEQDLEETTAEDSKQGKDMQVSGCSCAKSICTICIAKQDQVLHREYHGTGCSFRGSTTE